MPSPSSSAELFCKNGHPVAKFKKLRPWQGHVTDRSCSLCGQVIDRKEFRWRCEEHCNWDLCSLCYDRHWKSVLFKASRMDDPGRRAELLQAVPVEMRPEEQPPVVQASPRRPPLSPQRPAPASEEDREIVDDQPATFSAAASTAKLVVLWVLITWLISKSFSTLLEGKEPLFPNPWLLAGLAHALAVAVCKLLVRVSGYDNSRDEEAVDITSAAVLGLMFGMESGIYTGMFTDWVAGSHEEAFLLRPAAMCAAGLLAGTEPLRGRLAVVAIGTTLGGVLVAPGGADWPGAVSSFPSLFLAGLLTAFRWVFVLNVLPRGGGMPPLWFFAGQLMWPSAAVCFELAVLSDYSCYRQIFHLPSPGIVAMHVLALAVLSGAQVAVELRMVQVTSLVMLGLATPLLNVVSVVKLYFAQAKAPVLQNFVGLGFYAASVLLYWKSRHGHEPPKVTVKTAGPTDPTGYQRLEAGASPRSIRSPKPRTSTHSGSGAGHAPSRAWLPVPGANRLQPPQLGASPTSLSSSQSRQRSR